MKEKTLLLSFLYTHFFVTFPPFKKKKDFNQKLDELLVRYSASLFDNSDTWRLCLRKKWNYVSLFLKHNLLFSELSNRLFVIWLDLATISQVRFSFQVCNKERHGRIWKHCQPLWYDSSYSYGEAWLRCSSRKEERRRNGGREKRKEYQKRNNRCRYDDIGRSQCIR